MFVQVADQVLALKRSIIITHTTGRKFTPKWEGPYAVREVYIGGAYKIMNGQKARVGPINGKLLKCYFP